MATASGQRPEILGGSRVRLAQPLVDAAEYPRDPFGRQLAGLPGSNGLPKRGVERRKRRDAETRTNQNKAMVVAGQKTSPVRLCQVQESRVREIQGVSVRQLKNRSHVGPGKVLQVLTGPWATCASFWETRAGSSPYTFVRTAFASNSTKGDVNQPVRALSNCSHGVVAVVPKKAVHQDHRVEHALQRRAKRRSSPVTSVSSSGAPASPGLIESRLAKMSSHGRLRGVKPCIRFSTNSRHCEMHEEPGQGLAPAALRACPRSSPTIENLGRPTQGGSRGVRSPVSGFQPIADIAKCTKNRDKGLPPQLSGLAPAALRRSRIWAARRQGRGDRQLKGQGKWQPPPVSDQKSWAAPACVWLSHWWTRRSTRETPLAGNWPASQAPTASRSEESNGESGAMPRREQTRTRRWSSLARETSPVRLCQVQESRVREIQGMSVPPVEKPQPRRPGQGLQSRRGRGPPGRVSGDQGRVLAVHLCQDGLRLEQHQGRREPARAGSQQLLARCRRGVVPKKAVHQDHRVEHALQRRARRGRSSPVTSVSSSARRRLPA